MNFKSYITKIKKNIGTIFNFTDLYQRPIRDTVYSLQQNHFQREGIFAEDPFFSVFGASDLQKPELPCSNYYLHQFNGNPHGQR